MAQMTKLKFKSPVEVAGDITADNFNTDDKGNIKLGKGTFPESGTYKDASGAEVEAFENTFDSDKAVGSAFLGGHSNTIKAPYGYICGGYGNVIEGGYDYDNPTVLLGGDAAVIINGKNCVVKSHMSYAGGDQCQVRPPESSDEMGYTPSKTPSGDNEVGTAGAQLNSKGYASFAQGNNVIITGGASAGFGTFNRIYARYGLVTGHNNFIYHDDCVLGGESNKTTATHQAIFGKCNAQDTDALFMIGNGTINIKNGQDKINRSNAFTVRKNGAVISGIGAVPSIGALLTIGNGTRTTNNDGTEMIRESNAFEVISTIDKKSAIKIGETELTEDSLKQLLAILTNDVSLEGF